MKITVEQLVQFSKHIGKETAEKIVHYFNQYSPEYDLTTEWRVQQFFAQGGHESQLFTRFEENLNYSTAGLIATFGKYFKDWGHAAQYARHPEKIANYVYANRGGNGDEKSGDGWKYRGRGIFQTTLKENYIALSKHLYGDYSLLERPQSLVEPVLAVRSALFYWKSHDLNRLADAGAFQALTLRINAAGSHMQERINLWDKAKKIFLE
jgi:putative chitinase